MEIALSKSAQKELDHLEDKLVLRISRKLTELADNPYGLDSKKLAGGKGYRIRIGDYRIVYTVDKENNKETLLLRNKITLIKIGHRREIYR